MPGIGTILSLLKFAPAVFEVVRQVRHQRPAREETGVDDARLADVTQRLRALEDEQDYLRRRLQDLSAALETLQVIVYIGGGLLIAATVVLLILILLR